MLFPEKHDVTRGAAIPAADIKSHLFVLYMDFHPEPWLALDQDTRG